MAKNGDVFDCYSRDTRRTSSEDVFDSAGDTAEAGVDYLSDFVGGFSFGLSELLPPMKHYLQGTDRQFSEAAGVAQGVAPAQVIGNQGISENSPTLKNKAFPVIDHHDLSQEMPEWAMRDSRRLALTPYLIG